ncbi:glycoside hydrolase family 28 protein [Flavobacterium sp. RHBU_3]|uniref:glycoside hydrolase family 28 protein n=1 Tax=Flavobacterium sp. RHBU_3 TaxID=3391184 RepID=UPI003984884C
MFKQSIYKYPVIAASGLLILFSCASKKDKKSDMASGWEKMQLIIDQVQPPVFNNKVFNVADYGAVADGQTNNTAAFDKAIKACNKAGGGVVKVTPGKYFTGPIHLESNVNLNIEEGAEILFSLNPDDYYPLVQTSFEGTEMMNYSPLIYAYNKTNVAVTGKGILNGQANKSNWWTWMGQKPYGWEEGMPSQRDSLNRLRLVALAEDGVPVDKRIFGRGHYLRPNFVEFFECKNAMLEGVTIVNAPFWIIHPMKSENVLVKDVTIRSHGPNNDGCDPEYSKNVVIQNCIFDTGDDCIAIKSGRDADGRRVAMPSENIVVKDCKMYDGHGGVTIGSEISASVRNVYVDNCDMDSPELDRAIRIKTNTRRGGIIENVYVRNIRVGQVKESVLGMTMFYDVHGNQTGDFMPIVRNIFLEDVTVKNGGKYGILAKGYKESPITNIVFKNVTIEKVEKEYSLENVKDLRFVNTNINGSEAITK